MPEILHCGEKTVAASGVTSGLLDVRQHVTWRAKHFGVWHTLTSEITAVDRPAYFQDTMIRGIFRYMRHDHFFRLLSPGLTEMRDVFCFAAPFAVRGAVAEIAFLGHYMQRTSQRAQFGYQANSRIGGVAENICRSVMKILIPGGSGTGGPYPRPPLSRTGSYGDRPEPKSAAGSLARDHLGWHERKGSGSVTSKRATCASISPDAASTADTRRRIGARSTNPAIQSTLLLNRAIGSLKHPPRLWVNASTATIYRHSLDRAMDEADRRTRRQRTRRSRHVEFLHRCRQKVGGGILLHAHTADPQGRDPQRHDVQPRPRRSFRRIPEPRPLRLRRPSGIGQPVRFLDSRSRLRTSH